MSTVTPARLIVKSVCVVNVFIMTARWRLVTVYTYLSVMLLIVGDVLRAQWHHREMSQFNSHSLLYIQ